MADAIGAPQTKKYDLCIIGGCGHVGLPLGMAFADTNLNVVLYDINKSNVNQVNKAEMPFMEEGGAPLLKKVVKSKKLLASTDKNVISQSKVVVLVIGTPVDEYLNPKVLNIIEAIKQIEDQLDDSQLLVMRSTLYPGITDKVYEHLQAHGRQTKVAFCPERITEGRALEEFELLPQIVAGCTDEANQAAKELFQRITKEIIITKTTEAELAKLFTNTWRYINFAISNQFYMIANSHGLDFYKIYGAMTKDYPRLKAFSKAGFAAGPCLFKDTMQLSSFSGNNFFLGHSAMLVNEGLPDFIVDAMKEKYYLKHQTVAILGMAFKAENDDKRESLSFKLKKRLEFEAKEVLCHDPYLKDSRFASMEEIKKKADIIIVAAPHKAYKSENWDDREVVDIWNFYEQGGLI